MSVRERTNLLKLYMLLVGYSKEVTIDFFELHLKNENKTFEEFINSNEHAIYHLCFHTKQCCKTGCKVSRQNPFVPFRILNIVQLEKLFDQSSKPPCHPNHGGKCCKLAKRNIGTNIMDITLTNCLLTHFCHEIFWNSFLKQGESLPSFLESKKHKIFHLFNGSERCCMCSNSGCPDVTEESFYNCEWLYLFNTPTGNCCTKNEPTHICSYSATVTLNTTNLEKEYATALLKQFCPARRAVDALVKWRNKYGHPEEIFLPDAQYRIEKSSIDNEIMILASFSGKDAQTRQKLSELEDISLDPELCEQYRNTLLEQIDGVTDLKEVVLKFQDSCSTHLKKQDGQLVNIDAKTTRAEIITLFYNIYLNTPSQFIKDQFITLSKTDSDNLCDRCAKFEIKTVKYADYKVFMSQLETSWIRISECKEKNTQFKFKRSTKSDQDKQFFHIESVDRPRHYVTMGFLDIWVRAKFYDDVSSEDDATWDIRCLKTVDQKGNSLPKYLLVPKSSQSFLCVDRTNRLRGCSDHLDVSKMFIFSKVN